MGLLAWWNGVDEDELRRKEAEADAWNLARNEQLYREGKLSEANYKLSNEQLNRDETGDVDAQLGEAFDEGLSEGADNIAGVVRQPFSLAGWGIFAILKGVPWWVWLSAATYFAWRLGLLDGVFKGVVRRARR